MKILISVLTVIINCYWATGQVCGTIEPLNKIVYSNSTYTNVIANSQNNCELVNTTSFCINLFINIVRNTNGTNAFLKPNFDDFFIHLNKYYNPHNIAINFGGVGYIDNSDFVNIDSRDEADQLGLINNQSNAMNCYLVDKLWTEDDNPIYGIANGIPSNSFVIAYDEALTMTSPHELGHCLNLLHTHETALGIEEINGSNCCIAGDLVCDTPADPNLNGKVVFCFFYGGDEDYDPLLNNIMSYTPSYCREEFTNGQGNRMRNVLSVHPAFQTIFSVTNFVNETWSSDKYIGGACDYPISISDIKINQQADITIITGEGGLIIDGSFDAEKGVMLNFDRN